MNRPKLYFPYWETIFVGTAEKTLENFFVYNKFIEISYMQKRYIKPKYETI